MKASKKGIKLGGSIGELSSKWRRSSARQSTSITTKTAGRNQGNQPSPPPVEPPAGWRRFELVAMNPVVSSFAIFRLFLFRLHPFLWYLLN